MSPMRAIFIGTLAPATARMVPRPDSMMGLPGHHVCPKLSRVTYEKWSDSWSEIKRCNPLTAISPEFKKRLRVERDHARTCGLSRLKGRFLVVQA